MELFSEHSICKNKLNKCEIYCPVVLPLHEVAEKPEKIVEVINRLESFPEAANKPIFDHYIVLVPAFAVVDLGRHGEIKSQDTPDYWQLIKKGECVPLLIGEKDGKCYFICYFMENNYEMYNN